MPKLTITFDNGPTPGITNRVLDVLADFNVKATFFMVGKSLQSPGGSELALRVKKEGHWIGNHTLSHGIPLGLQHEQGKARKEIEDMDNLLLGLSHESHRAPIRASAHWPPAKPCRALALQPTVVGRAGQAMAVYSCQRNRPAARPSKTPPSWVQASGLR